MTRSKGSPAVLLKPEHAGVVQAVFDANAGLSLRKLGDLVAAQLGLAACNEASLHRFVVAHRITRQMPQHVIDRSARLAAKGAGLMHAELRPISPVKRTGGVTGSLPRAVAGCAQSVSILRLPERVTTPFRLKAADPAIGRGSAAPSVRTAASRLDGAPSGFAVLPAPCPASTTSSSTASLPLADQVDERPGTPASATAAWALGPLGLTGGGAPSPRESSRVTKTPVRTGTRRGAKW